MTSLTGRREFMLGSLALPAAVAQTAGSGREIRTAYIGIGIRGSELLKQALAQPNVRVSAICDTDANARDRAQGMAARDSPKAFTDYRAVVDLKDVDAVFVGSPCDLHAEMAAACLEAGKYVYCEKPLGITPEQVERVLRAASKSKAFLQIGQQLRYYPVVREAIRLLHSEKVLGEIFVVKAQRHSTPISPEAERNRPAWYKDVKRSGDLIVENAVHNIDLCNWITGSRPVSAYGHGKKYFPEPIPAGTEMMDGFSVEYIYENDVHLDYSQLYMHPRALKRLENGQWYMVFGQKGALAIEYDAVDFYAMDAEAPRDLIPAELKERKENAMSEFLACIREGRKPFADVKVGAVAALTAIMGREAIYRRQMVTWKDLGVNV